MPESDNPLPGGGNLIVAALKGVFGPIVKVSSKWPPILAYGLPGIVAVMLIVLLRSSVPDNLVLLVALIVTLPLVGYIVTDILARSKAEKAPDGGEPMFVSIEKPRAGQVVKRTIKCYGTASGIGPQQHLWLAVEANGLVWPKEPEVIVAKKSNRWEVTIFEDGATNVFCVALYLAEPEGHKNIQDWLEKGKQKGEYAEINGVLGAQRIARIDRLRLSRRV